MSDRKSAFFEIGRGQLGRDFQEDFEKAQQIAAEREVPVKLKFEIVVNAPDKKDPMYGSVSYSHSLHEPAHKSRVYDTILNNGIIVKDAEQGADQLDLLDLELDKKPRVLKMEKEA